MNRREVYEASRAQATVALPVSDREAGGLNWREMYKASEATASALRVKLASTEAELTNERTRTVVGTEWHPIPRTERAEGFALTCMCPECKLDCKLAGVAQLERRIAAADKVAREAVSAAQARFPTGAREALERAKADAEAEVRVLKKALASCRVRESALSAQCEELRRAAHEAVMAANTAVERTAAQRASYKKLACKARRVLALAPLVVAGLRGGFRGTIAVREARAALAEMANEPDETPDETPDR